MAENGELEAGQLVKTTFMKIGKAVRSVQYTVVEGHAVVEGCIVLGTEKEAELSLKHVQTNPGALRDGVEALGSAIVGEGYRWPNGEMVYEIHRDLPKAQRVTDAIAHWKSKTSIKFTLRDAANDEHKHYVVFVPGSGCRSAVGMRGGRQEIVLGANCTTGNAIHEIGHALGLWHEQSRGDRDAHIRVRYDRIQAGMEHNFSQHIADGIDIQDYDYGSIMHYPLDAFSVDGQPTIEVIGDYKGPIGQREGLSKDDVNTIEQIYAKARSSK